MMIYNTKIMILLISGFIQLIILINSQSLSNNHNNHSNEGMIRLIGGRTMFEGNIEINHFGQWGMICDDEWDLLDANVACKQLGFVLGAIMATNMSRYGKGRKPIWMDNVWCNGKETKLSSCRFDGWNIHDCESNESAGVICRVRLDQQPIWSLPSKPTTLMKKQPKTTMKNDLPDLEPDPLEVERSAFIEHRSILFLQCAMEENCLSQSAYEIDKNDPTWIFNTRILLRFTASIRNIGKSDFRPFRKKNQWLWHSCHQHYHSMEIFATFDLIDINENHIAQGHKASFCLEDNECYDNGNANYVCADYGDQGISVNCVDIYKSDLDCQWIDITDIRPGSYRMKIIINPERKVEEKTFENNVILCSFIYNDNFNGSVTNCTLNSL
ncbi:lysyl oxidase homolog 2-like [Dermatophagoides pteronyssinus]|uniref:lysyl oxidase homolog 2-like n=1 Tax=Dermatophagoides pteronyssinus TaxID=6956 RepID=UPI003F677E25